MKVPCRPRREEAADLSALEDVPGTLHLSGSRSQQRACPREHVPGTRDPHYPGPAIGLRAAIIIRALEFRDGCSD